MPSLKTEVNEEHGNIVGPRDFPIAEFDMWEANREGEGLNCPAGHISASRLAEQVVRLEFAFNPDR